MDYGKLAVDLLQRGLSRDEQAIASIAGRVVEPRTIGVYSEYWLQYLLFKEALLCADCPTVRLEGEKVDIRFMDGETILAEFELKGPFPCKSRRPGSQKLEGVIDDFKKQCTACTDRPQAAHYVLVAVTGDPSEVQEWLKDVLVPEIRDKQPNATLMPIASDPIPLNPVEGMGSVLILFAIQIATAAKAANAE